MLTRIFFGNPIDRGIRISQFGVWSLIFMASIPFSVAVMIPGNWPSTARSLIVIGVVIFETWFVITKCLQEIPASPEPHRGIYQWFGARTHTEFEEGTVFRVPAIESLFPVNVKVRPYSFDIEDILAKGPAHMRARVQAPFVPNGNRLLEFVTMGEDAGVTQLLVDLIKERLRAFLVDRPRWRTETRRVLRTTLTSTGSTQQGEEDEPYQLEPWEDAMTMRDQMYPDLIEAITGQKLETEDLRAITERQGGQPDNHGWGIRLRGLVIPTIVPTKQTAAAADERSKEAAERAGRVFEKTTEAMMAGELVRQAAAMGQTISFDDALQVVLEHETARQGHGLALPGVPAALRSLSLTPALQALIQALLDGRGRRR